MGPTYPTDTTFKKEDKEVRPVGNFAKKMNKMKRINAVGKSMEEMYKQLLNNMDFLKANADRVGLMIGFQQQMIEKVLGKEYCETEFELYKERILKEMADEDAKRKAAESGEKVVESAEIAQEVAVIDGNPDNLPDIVSGLST